MILKIQPCRARCICDAPAPEDGLHRFTECASHVACSAHPATGETLTAAAAFTCLGGKGANQALAAARAGGGIRQAVKNVAQDVTHLELPMGPIIFES